MIRLTNHLYPVEQVIASLVESLTAPSDLKLSLFWLWELTYTLDNISDGILCIVSLFYSHAPRPLLQYISRKCAQVDESSSELHEKARMLSDLLTNLRRLSPSFNGYMIHQSFVDEANRPNFLYRAADAPVSSVGCLRGAMARLDYQDIGFYLARLPHALCSPVGAIGILWKGRDVPNDGIALAAMAARSLAQGDVRIPRSWRFTTCAPSIVDELRSLYGLLDDPNIDPSSKLALTRKYRVTSVACMAPTLPSLADIMQTSRLHWLGAAGCGNAWRQRLGRYGATVTEDGCKFPSDNAEDEFNNVYALDFDEQSSAVQMRSIVATGSGT